VFNVALWVVDRSATAYYRTVLPHRHLQERLAGEGLNLVLHEGPLPFQGHGYDAVVFPRVVPPEAWPLLLALAEDGVRVGLDVDDALHLIPDWSPVKRLFCDNTLVSFEHAVRRCDVLSVSTRPLAEALGRRDARVCPNLVDPALAARRPARAHEKRVVWAGHNSHAHDLDEAVLGLELLARRGWELIFFGYCPPAVKEHLNPFVLPAVPLADYHRVLAWLRPDAAVCPLSVREEDLPFNRCKSPIKFYEFTYAGAACVVQGIPPYGCGDVHGGHALVVGGDYGWEDAARFLDELGYLGRRNAAEGAMRHVSQHHSWASPAAEAWADFYHALKGDACSRAGSRS
jgi:hypothetical protein